jgi:uncharacterized protein
VVPVSDITHDTEQLVLPDTPVDEASAAIGERLGFLDAARGLAVFGMLLRNVFVFGIPTSAYGLPMIWSGDSPFDLFSWALVDTTFDGSMRGLFSILFGTSAMMILSSRDAGMEASDLYHRRLMWLMLFGLVHAYVLLSPIDILFIYGLFGLLIYPLRNASAKALLVTAGAGIAIGMAIAALSAIAEMELTQTQAMTGEAQTPPIVLAAAEEAPPAAEIPGSESDASDQLLQEWLAEMTDRHEGYLFNVISLAQESFANHSTSLFSSHFLDVGVMLLIGMALFKLGVTTGRRGTGFYMRMMLICYGIGIPLNSMEVVAEVQSLNDTGLSATWPLLTYDIGRILMTLGHLGLMFVLCSSSAFDWLTDALKASGRLALTNYVMQTLFMTLIFFGFGLSYYGRCTHSQLLMIGLGVGLLQLIGSGIYVKYYRQGPLEYLLRRLSAGRA